MDTPYVWIDIKKLEKNIAAMAALAQRQGVKLRPHIKAHKIPEIAQLQIAAGAKGITVSKLGEAEVMFEAGFDDILVAYPLVGKTKLQRLATLVNKGCRIIALTDSYQGAEGLDSLAIPGGLGVMVKVDTGLGRCGFTPGAELKAFVRWLKGRKNLNFKGLLTHAGHAYGCKDQDQVRLVGVQEGEQMVACAQALRSQGIEVPEVSIGSTPTVEFGGGVNGVTEIRPGNYVFYDATQVALGVVHPGRCSLKVRSTVISRPARDRAIIDAGAKVLALDQGAHGGGAVAGFGLLEKPDWALEKLSEEHGILRGRNLPEIGKSVDIVPNHACPVVNLANSIYVSDGREWAVAARGRVK